MATAVGDKNLDVADDVMKASMVTALLLKENTFKRSRKSMMRIESDVAFLFEATKHIENDVALLTKEKESLEDMVQLVPLIKTLDQQLKHLLEVKSQSEMAINTTADLVKDKSSLILFSQQPVNSNVPSLIQDMTKLVDDHDKIKNLSRASGSCLDLFHVQTQVNSMLDECEGLKQQIQITSEQLARYEAALERL